MKIRHVESDRVRAMAVGSLSLLFGQGGPVRSSIEVDNEVPSCNHLEVVEML